MESTEQHGPGIVIRSDQSNREKWSTSKGGLIFSKLFQLEIFVEWIAPGVFGTLSALARIVIWHRSQSPNMIIT